MSRPEIRVVVDKEHVQNLCHCKRFDVDEFLLVRRGTEFPVHLSAPYGYSLKVEHVRLVQGEKLRDPEVVEVSVTGQRAMWRGIDVSIVVPVATPVWAYKLVLSGDVESIWGGGAKTEFQVELVGMRVVVLFNAWCEEDGVFVADEQEREEYVLNSNGRVYAGSLYGMPWNLSLYRPDSLRAVLFLMENTSWLEYRKFADPLQVAREFTALVNVQGDNGLLVGRWDGDYADGHAPSSWRGSGKILEQYYRSGGIPVEYGQCWVFSGVLLSCLRILGIPSRSVTNFSSAHDTNRNRSIDQYYDAEGEEISYLSSGSDSVWNFHVWNEAYLARPDLPKGFGGWQALDATPQEESPQGGGYKLGPTSVKAVKEGQSLNYDTNFVIAEVNADIKKYMVEDGVPRLFKVETTTVGKYLSTKGVLNSDRVDLTSQYKYAEGSDMERKALYHGYKELLKEEEEVEFSIPVVEQSEFGKDINFLVKARNKTDHSSAVRGSITCTAVAYTGRVLKQVDKLSVDSRVAKDKTATFTLKVDGSIFSQYPREKVYLKFTVVLAVTGTSQVFSEQLFIGPDPPKVRVQAPKQLELGAEGKVSVEFTNPLPFKMSDVTVTVECDELLEKDMEYTIGSIEGGGTFHFPVVITGLVLGKHQLVVGVDSDSVELVTGEAEVEVVEKIESQPPAPAPADEPSGSDATPLEVTGVNFNIAKNESEHHTPLYDTPMLVVRRGQKFTITLTNRTALPEGAVLVARASFMLNPVSLTFHTRKPNSFEVDTVVSVAGREITVDLCTPGNTPIGRYEMTLTLGVNTSNDVVVVHDGLTLMILFNPWCKEDTCYYGEDASHLEEYVLNNKGLIWVGSSTSNYGRPWQFAQFQKDSLAVLLYLLDKMKISDRGNPIMVTRELSALVNSQDDNGVVTGNWSGDYEGGTSPLSWTGSASILAEYNRTKRPVRYGQCWVFSGVQTTLLRCTGIAARSITNFSSAHDTNFNRAVDKYYDQQGNVTAQDSIWNFHVWNEAYMSRPDLPKGFGGWQVLDATPQEESPQGGGYRLGPTPRYAVKLGQRLKYDVEFVYSEVNADVRYYMRQEDGSTDLVLNDTSAVGKNISTKAVGGRVREDVTLDYKFAGGSTLERIGTANTTESQKQMSIHLDVDDNVEIGSPFTVAAKVTNKLGDARLVSVSVVGRAELYTGAPGQRVTISQSDLELMGGGSQSVEVKVETADYLRILEGAYFIRFTAVALSSDKQAAVLDTTLLRLKTPDVDITVPPGGLQQYRPAVIKVAVRNPLNSTLTGGQFVLHSEGLLQESSASVGRVGPRARVEAELETLPLRKGSFVLVVTFSCDQLSDLMGDQDATVV